LDYSANPAAPTGGVYTKRQSVTQAVTFFKPKIAQGIAKPAKARQQMHEVLASVKASAK
jgi:hypothetical protein